MIAAGLAYTEVTEFLVYTEDERWEFSIFWQTPNGLHKSDVLEIQGFDVDPETKIPHRAILAFYREKLWQNFERSL